MAESVRLLTANIADRQFYVLLASVRGTEIWLHKTYFALLFLSALNGFRKHFAIGPILLFGPILLLTICIHELGHALTALSQGAQVEHILLWPLGGMAFCGPTSNAWSDLKVAVAGPIMHVPMALCWLGLHYSARGASFWATLFEAAAWLNVQLLLFNLLLPAFPLVSTFARAMYSVYKAQRVHFYNQYHALFH